METNEVNKPRTVPCCFKTLIPKEFTHKLNTIEDSCRVVVKRMLQNRKETSSKFYKEVPCVIAKSLSTKYQRNRKCKSVRNIVIPICGDKGKQIKLVPGGVRIPALFKKNIVPIIWLRPVAGFVRSVEFYHRGGRWFASFCVNTPAEDSLDVKGVIGIDRNSVGNVAVMVDLQNGHVRHLGFNPAKTKVCWRGRKKNLQRQGKRRLLSKLRKNHARRTTYENHVVSRAVVNYAKKHSRAIVMEKLTGIRAKKSKTKFFSEKSQWAFAQLATFIHYKARLAGVPVMEVNPAYTSQTCSRCGSIHKPEGKAFKCPDCKHEDHRDANASFNIAKRGWENIGGLATDSVRRRSGLMVAPILGSGAIE